MVNCLVQGDTIPYQYDPFWKGKWCPAHSSDGTLKCCSCSRLNPRGQEWVTELDGRTVCLDCLSSLVRDTSDAQPLYDQVTPAGTPPSAKAAAALPAFLLHTTAKAGADAWQHLSLCWLHLHVISLCSAAHLPNSVFWYPCNSYVSRHTSISGLFY